MEHKIKEITNITENGKNKTKIIFTNSQEEQVIVFEGEGKFKTAVAEI